MLSEFTNISGCHFLSSVPKKTYSKVAATRSAHVPPPKPTTRHSGLGGRFLIFPKTDMFTCTQTVGHTNADMFTHTNT